MSELVIRRAWLKDTEAQAAIYASYVRESAVAFDREARPGRISGQNGDRAGAYPTGALPTSV